jgi:hypothetical protein
MYNINIADLVKLNLNDLAAIIFYLMASVKKGREGKEGDTPLSL